MTSRIIGIILGFLTALGGVTALTLGIISSIASATDEDRFALGASLIPSGVLTLAIGIALVWLAARALWGKESRPIGLPPWWFSLAVFAIAIGIGWAALRLDQWWLFFPFAALAVFAPVAAIGWLGVPRQGPRPSWRRIVPAFAWGALVAPPVAIVIEGLVLFAILLMVIAGFAVAGEVALETVRQTVEQLQGRTLTDAQTQSLVRTMIRQPIVLLLGALFLAFVAPVVEEFCKFGAVLLFARGRSSPEGPVGAARGRPDSVLTIFLIGLAAGLGFAATENVFYAMQSGAGGWPAMAALRATTPVMHGAASALFALGWARQMREPQGWGLLRGALAALALHGAWNFLAGCATVVALLATSSDEQAVAGLLAFGIGGILVALGFGSAWALYRLGRALGREAQQETERARQPAAPLPPLAPVPFPGGLPARPRPEPSPVTIDRR